MSDKKNLQSLIETCIREEEELQFESFTNEQALQLGLQIVERARKAGQSVAIDITRHGQQLFHHGMHGTAADNDAWMQRKNATVNRVFVSSYHFFLKLTQSGETLHGRGLDEAKFAAAGGGFPIRIRNAGVVGTVTVSGLPHEQDHELVVETLRAFLG